MKQVSLSKLLIQQILLAILTGLLISLPVTLIPAYFIVQSNIQQTVTHLEQVSHAEVNQHLVTGWRQANIDLILQHLNQEIPGAYFYLQKHPSFVDTNEHFIPPEADEIKQLIQQVEANNQAASKASLFSDKLYAAYPIKFKERCLTCHQAEVKAGTIVLNQPAGIIAFEAPFSTAMVSTFTQVLFFILFMSTFISAALYLTNRSIHLKLLDPLQDLSKRIVSLQLDSHTQASDWKRTPHEIIEIDEKVSQHIHFIQGIYSKLDALIVTEHETGLFHRDRFNEVMSYELMRSKRYEHEFCVVVIKLMSAEPSDMEYFNSLSEEQQNTAKVHRFSQLISKDSRATDLVFRITEDLFVVIAPETGLKGAEVIQSNIVDHLKHAQHSEIKHAEYRFNFHFKIGFGHYPTDGQTAKKIMHEAAIRMKSTDY